jgi:phosphoribosylformylglycinamidine cyclo-ligase
VGVVERERIIDGRTIEAGDALIGLASSGAHSNGFSLVRRIHERSGADLHAPFAAGRARSLGDALLAPTRIYVKPVLALLDAVPVKGMAHITGGGLTENVPRMLPAALAARLESNRWTRPAIFDWLQRAGNVDDAEMHRVFNCGLGLVVAMAPEHAERALAVLRATGAEAQQVGSVVPRTDGAPATIVA